MQNLEKKAQIFLDQGKYFDSNKTDAELFALLNQRLFNTDNQEAIGSRYRECLNNKLLFYSKAVELYVQSQSLYSLGYFELFIMVARSIVEYIVFDIYSESSFANKTSNELNDFIRSSIDMRKLLNNFLKENGLVSSKIKSLANDIYDEGNKFVHPKKVMGDEELSDKAKDIFHKLKELINLTKDVMISFTFKDGRLISKEVTK